MCNDYEQHFNQIKNRRNVLIDFELLHISNETVNNKSLPINRYVIDRGGLCEA